MAQAPNPAVKLRHVRPVRPLHFPVEEPMEEHLGQSTRHWDLCVILWLLLRSIVDKSQHSCGADQFVYWNPRNPRRCLAPDAFVKLHVPWQAFDNWKTWERGIPELAVELLSPSDTKERFSLAKKILRYNELGIRELISFNVDAPLGQRLRAWDLIEGDLVERLVEAETTPCLTLPGVEWIVAPAEDYPSALRLRKDGELVALDRELYRAEHERAVRAEEERDRATAERDRATSERDRATVERDEALRERDAIRDRVAALEAKLRER